MSEPLTAYIVSSNIGASFHCGLNGVVLDRGTALYLASEVQARLDALTQERDEWHAYASSHLLALVEMRAELNGAEQQLATAQARMTPIIDALESLCHAVERGETDDDYLRVLAENGRCSIATLTSTERPPA